MKRLKSGQIGGKDSRRNWHPPPAHGRGELALGRLLQENGIRFESQVPIKTDYSASTFLVDYLLLDKPIILECDGQLHYRTWKGHLAVGRMRKDEAKTKCLTSSGFKVLRFPDTEVLKNPSQVLTEIRKALQ